MSPYIKSLSFNTCKRMISSSLFTESLAVSCVWNSNIPPSKTGLSYIVKRMAEQPKMTHQTTQGVFQNAHRVRPIMTSDYAREPIKPTSTTIKRRHHMRADGSSDRFEYTTTSMGKTNTQDTLGKVDAPAMNGHVGGGWGLEWCRLLEIVAISYWEHGPDNSEKSYVDKVFFNLYAEGIASIRERTIYSTVDGVSICRGRVDLEVAGRYLLEFKITEPSATNIRKDTRQLMRYLVTYDESHFAMQKAALVYLFGGEVRFIEVALPTDKRYKPYGK